jgi:DNA-binding XRE family transcriptional regulator
MTMQGEGLKAVRTALGLSQAAFGKALGLTREAINKMESGTFPIERRTELAALYLAEHPEIVE